MSATSASPSQPVPYIGNQPRSSAQMDAWLRQSPREQALEPALPIVDAHHHLWDLPHEQKRYLLPDLLADLNGGHNIVATVYIEASSMWRADGPLALKPVGEIEFAAGVAAIADSGTYGRCRVAAGIVGYADLRLGAEVAAVLEREVEASGRRLRGIRQQLSFSPGKMAQFIKMKVPEHLALDAQFEAGYAQLARFGLSFDAWLYHPQLPDLRALADRFPDTTIVLNHVGGPIGVDVFHGRRDEVFAVWHEDMQALAQRPNVFVKLGGLGMPMFGFGYEREALPPTSAVLAQKWKPYIETVIELFGVDRCLFESNFPVDKQSCDYVSLWNAYKLLTAQMSTTERSALFSGTATRVYRLG